jgi:hypothetical protein
MFSKSEIFSEFEMRKLMKALAFRFLHLHCSYYVRISSRADVILHRSKLVPELLLAMTDPRAFFVNFDFSFAYQNEFSPNAWISLARKDADLVDSKPGKGPRFSFCEFISRTGIIRHPDGKSAGSTFPHNEMITADIVRDCIRRGCVGIKNHPTVQKGAQPFLLIDNARVQATKKPSFINPKDMNVSDAGKNRVEMDQIGYKGLKSVLSEHGRWVDGMSKCEAEAVMWASKMVQSQLTNVEEICKEYGIILIYNAKAHPWFAMIEKFWRWLKRQLRDLLSLEEIRANYDKFVENFMSNDTECMNRCEKWFQQTLKYVQYYACGGRDVVREADMRHLDLSEIGNSCPRNRFSSMDMMMTEAHDANWIAICGKKFQPTPEFWE